MAVYKIKDWSETPWRIASTNQEPQNLSVPELHDYLRFNADFPTPSSPLSHPSLLSLGPALVCLVVVFIAAPLGIVYSRRGVLAGVAGSIFIFFSMIFLTNLFLALGKGDRIPPLLAAWTPNAVFAVVGAFLLYLRASNRELPKFSFNRTKK